MLPPGAQLLAQAAEAVSLAHRLILPDQVFVRLDHASLRTASLYPLAKRPESCGVDGAKLMVDGVGLISGDPRHEIESGDSHREASSRVDICRKDVRPDDGKAEPCIGGPACRRAKVDLVRAEGLLPPPNWSSSAASKTPRSWTATGASNRVKSEVEVVAGGVPGA